MAEEPIGEAALAALARYDTPTVCNALEIVAPERRAIGFTTHHLHASNPAMKPMVGYARTVTFHSAAPAGKSAAVARAHRAAYFDYVAAGPRPITSSGALFL